MNRVLIGLVVLFAVGGLATRLSGQSSGQVESKPKAQSIDLPKVEQSATRHKIVIGGAAISYSATAGTVIVRNAQDTPYASMGYIAYTKNDVADPSRRPITFSYNGGPGSSSIWLHMGALGPRRIVTADGAATPPPPYKIVDNESSILDSTDGL